MNETTLQDRLITALEGADLAYEPETEAEADVAFRIWETRIDLASQLSRLEEAASVVSRGRACPTSHPALNSLQEQIRLLDEAYDILTQEDK